MKVKIYVLIFLSVTLFQCTRKLPAPQNTPSVKIVSQSPKREMRGVWVATIENIDWPSKKGLSSEAQRNEFSEMISYQADLGFNSVFVQIRAASDAFYARSSEPWSEWLTGEQGKAPEPFYDPLRFMVEEAHEKNIEFHAWFNLNRGLYRNSKTLVQDHITLKHPEWFVSYDGNQVYNFGIPEVRDYITRLVLSVVKSYDIDGVHFDDYFYPYPVAGQVFDDATTFEKYNRGIVSLTDWRRDNINILVKQIADAIKAEKRWVKFGISPFGIWRNSSVDPAGSPTAGGQSYDDLFADTRKWAKEGWIDYIAPQIYFAFEHPKVPFQPLLDWWADSGVKCNLFVGHAIYKSSAESKDPGWSDSRQIPRQIAAARNRKEVSGSIFYSANWLKKNKLSISDSIQKAFSTPALVPTVPWKDDIIPASPQLFKAHKQDGKAILTWENVQVSDPMNEAVCYVVYRFENNNRDFENPSNILKVIRNAGELRYVDNTVEPGKSYFYGLTALDRCKNESLPVVSELIK